MAAIAAIFTVVLVVAATAPAVPWLYGALVAVAAIALLVVLFPPVREHLGAEWALAATSSPSAAHRGQAVGYLVIHAATLPPFARAALPDVLLRATYDPEPLVRWKALATLPKVVRYLPAHSLGAALTALAVMAERDRDPSMRAGAARAIASFIEQVQPAGRTHLFSVLPRLVQDPDVGVVASWCDVLPRVYAASGETAGPETVGALVRLMGSNEPVARWASRRAAVALVRLSTPEARAPVVSMLQEAVFVGATKDRFDALEDVMQVVPSLTAQEAAAVRETLARAVDSPEPALSGLALLAWAKTAGTNDPSEGMPPGGEGPGAASLGIVACARAIAASEFQRAMREDPLQFVINRSPEQVAWMTSGIKDPEPIIRRVSRAAIRAAFPLLAGETRESLLAALLRLHAEPEQVARTNASAALVDLRMDLSSAERVRVAEEVASLMSGGHESVRRQATVTAVGLAPTLSPESRALLLAALRDMARDPDAIVAEQARDVMGALVAAA